jgi:hypothetical protein
VGRMNNNDEFFGIIIGLFFGALVTGIIFTEIRVKKNLITNEKVFILDKATYKCTKTNELKVEK